MRPKVVAIVVVTGLVLLGTIIFAPKIFRNKPASSVNEGDIVLQTENASNNRGEHLVATNDLPERVVGDSQAAQLAAAIARTTNAPPQNSELTKLVEKRIAELDALSGKTDAGSVNTILSELDNPDKEIREAAREAAIQSRARVAIPRLQEIAARTEDAREKAEILDAIEFLKTPTFAEYRAERQAAGQTNLARSSQIQSNKSGKKIPKISQPNPN